MKTLLHCCATCEHWHKWEYIHCQYSGPYGGDIASNVHCVWQENTRLNNKTRKRFEATQSKLNDAETNICERRKSIKCLECGTWNEHDPELATCWQCFTMLPSFCVSV